MHTIAVIGANGQVGSEVCLFLSLYGDIKVFPISRTRLGSAFLRICGLSCRHGSVADTVYAPALLEGCDVVVDFSLPQGLYSDVCDAVRWTICGAVMHSPRRAKFIYASTLMVYGMGGSSRELCWYTVPRTSYGAWKRFAEQTAAKTCRAHSKPLFVLRLGQVHGELQSVSRGLTRSLAGEGKITVPACPSYTVFCFTIAEAVAQIARREEPPGTYTLVSSPEWTWEELYRHCANRIGAKVEIVSEPIAPLNRSILAALSRVPRYFAGRLVSSVKTKREILLPYLRWFPRIEPELRARNAMDNGAAVAQRATLREGVRQMTIFRGDIPGNRLRWLSDSRVTMESAAAKVRNMLPTARRRVWTAIPYDRNLTSR